MPELNDTQRLLELLQAGQPKPPTEVDTSTLRYALYARKSTTSEDRQASSIEDQIKECMEKLVSPNNLRIVQVYEESYSAKIADTRPRFNAMINEIENGRIDGVISWHPDRLSRNMKEAGTIIDLVDRGLIKHLQFATFTFENTPAGKMLLGITFVMAKQYSEHLSESVDRGNKRAVEDRTEFIGKFKHGYIVNIDREFQPDPHNFTKVKEMFSMALSGKSQKDIRLWINKQDYTVQKLPGGEYAPHIWDKDDVSKLLRDPHYAGVHKWGKHLTDLVKAYDFERMITVDEFLKINRVDSLNSSKVLAITRPKSGEIGADLLRGMVYCSKCSKTLTSMLIPKKDKDGNIIHSRYYYKCETEGCPMVNKSAPAGLVIEAAQQFFQRYLFVTKGNYTYYVEQAEKEANRKATEFTSVIARNKLLVANKEKSYEDTKELIANNPELKEHYDLNKYAKEIKKLKKEYQEAIDARDKIKSAIPSFDEYLKLLESTPVILSKIRDMKTMDALLRVFFSNFTIHPVKDDKFKGSKVTYKLNEPWQGFIDNDDFVCGAGHGTLTRGLILGKDAL
jgi:site-specific DNA recombinase